MNLSDLFSKTNPKREPRTVIIADDVATIRTIAGSVFKKAGCQIIEARNGDEVIQLSRTNKPHLIVMDLQMGSRGGVSAIEELLLDSTLKDIPVIILSGTKDPQVISQVKSYANVIDYIVKDHLPLVIQGLEKHV
jgi:CheY-like chemotaxis protein